MITKNYFKRKRKDGLAGKVYPTRKAQGKNGIQVRNWRRVRGGPGAEGGKIQKRAFLCVTEVPKRMKSGEGLHVGLKN